LNTRSAYALAKGRLVLDQAHRHGVIYRDVKPSNPDKRRQFTEEIIRLLPATHAQAKPLRESNV
jgi:hypothetical protein